MKSINRADFIAVGVVAKSHGTKGEIRVQLTENVKLKEWAFLEFQGKPVPFYIEDVSGAKDDPVLHLQGINTPDKAQQFTGRTILLPKTQVKRSKAKQASNVIGYTLIDGMLGEIGTLEAVEEMPQQTLLVTTYQGKQVLIPAVEEFITDIDDKKKQILVELPDGLLDF